MPPKQMKHLTSTKEQLRTAFQLFGHGHPQMDCIAESHCWVPILTTPALAKRSLRNWHWTWTRPFVWSRTASWVHHSGPRAGFIIEKGSMIGVSSSVCCEESAQANLSLFLNVFDVLVHFKAAIAATKVLFFFKPVVPRLGIRFFEGHRSIRN